VGLSLSNRCSKYVGSRVAGNFLKEEPRQVTGFDEICNAYLVAEHLVEDWRTEVELLLTVGRGSKEIQSTEAGNYHRA
jgi:hypothetical protein